jgi:hypothetical protein
LVPAPVVQPQVADSADASGEAEQHVSPVLPLPLPRQLERVHGGVHDGLGVAADEPQGATVGLLLLGPQLAVVVGGGRGRMQDEAEHVRQRGLRLAGPS